MLYYCCPLEEPEGRVLHPQQAPGTSREEAAQSPSAFIYCLAMSSLEISRRMYIF